MDGFPRASRALMTVVAGALLGLGACGGGDAAGADANTDADAGANTVVLGPRDVATATVSEMTGGVVLTGSLNPYRSAEVRAQVPGTVTGIRVDAGDRVGNGQVLATIEAQGIRSQAAGAQSAVAAAQANLALARRQLESARTLYQAGAMSEIDFRAAQTQLEAAEAQLAGARAQASTAGEAAARTTIRAPFAGEVGARMVEEGEAVNPGQALFRVVNTSILELAGQIPVEQAARVRAGQPAEFTLNAYPGRIFRGQVARVEPTADPQTRQVGVYVQLPNQDRRLVGGLFATGRIATARGDSSVTIPAQAVRTQGAQEYVLVVENGVVARRPVTTGPRDESRGVVAITAGLRGGEQIVVAPGEIAAGVRVRLAAATDSAAGTAAARDSAAVPAASKE